METSTSMEPFPHVTLRRYFEILPQPARFTCPTVLMCEPPASTSQRGFHILLILVNEAFRLTTLLSVMLDFLFVCLFIGDHLRNVQLQPFSTHCLALPGAASRTHKAVNSSSFPWRHPMVCSFILNLASSTTTAECSLPHKCFLWEALPTAPDA